MGEITTVENNNQLTIEEESQIETIKKTVARGATEHELKMFLHLANEYNLDPFKGEIYFIKYGTQATIMTSRDGYLKYAQSHPEFEGLVSFVVREKDEFSIEASTYTINHKFGKEDRGEIIGAWARCDRKGKKPFITFVDYSEYKKKSSVWDTYPSAMIQKVAETFVLKRAFGINGLVTKEELETQEVEYITKDQARELFALVPREKVHLIKPIFEKYNYTNSHHIRSEDYPKIYNEVLKLSEELKSEEVDENVVEEEVIVQEDEEIIIQDEEIKGEIE